ncbi:unnamed protein product [Schistocephalus solidus]|uniref:RT_RNaseH domain-containing protein n=1 Tax=Schistocephalus solidus TaxID=70667 RepID=A0A183SPE7_SCHSO|nr:unnamed protein product [Schistocephalus solidus]
MLPATPPLVHPSSKLAAVFYSLWHSFFKMLSLAVARYRTFSRELLAVYQAIRHFRYVLEGRKFAVITDHKPLVLALRATPDRYLPRDTLHLDFVSQFSCDIQHVHSKENVDIEIVCGKSRRKSPVLSDLHALRDDAAHQGERSSLRSDLHALRDDAAHQGERSSLRSNRSEQRLRTRSRYLYTHLLCHVDGLLL